MKRIALTAAIADVHHHHAVIRGLRLLLALEVERTVHGGGAAAALWGRPEAWRPRWLWLVTGLKWQWTRGPVVAQRLLVKGHRVFFYFYKL